MQSFGKSTKQLHKRQLTENKHYAQKTSNLEWSFTTDTTTINLSGRQLSKQNHHCFADKLTFKTWVSHLLSTDAQKYPS